MYTYKNATKYKVNLFLCCFYEYLCNNSIDTAAVMQPPKKACRMARLIYNIS